MVHVPNLAAGDIFGTLFLAGVSSFPELLVTKVSLRIGAIEMALGNLLGSNKFYMFTLGVDDMIYTLGQQSPCTYKFKQSFAFVNIVFHQTIKRFHIIKYKIKPRANHNLA